MLTTGSLMPVFPRTRYCILFWSFIFPETGSAAIALADEKPSALSTTTCFAEFVRNFLLFIRICFEYGLFINRLKITNLFYTGINLHRSFYFSIKRTGKPVLICGNKKDVVFSGLLFLGSFLLEEQKK